MPDLTISLTVPSASVTRIADAFIGMNPIPLDENDDPLYTDKGWVKHELIMLVKDRVERWEKRQATIAAQANVTIPEDIVT